MELSLPNKFGSTTNVILNTRVLVVIGTNGAGKSSFGKSLLDKYPDKAVLLYAQNYPDYGWAVLMGGGSCPVLHVDDERFLKDVPYMNVVPTDTDDYEMIASEDRGAVLNVHKAVELHIDLPSGKYALKYIDPESCKVTVLTQKMKVKDRFDLKTLKEGVYWLQRL